MKKEIIELLNNHNTMSLATSRDNSSYAASLFYASERLTLYFLSNPASEHSLNIALNPEVAVTINKDHSDWRVVRGLQIRGKSYKVNGDETERAKKVFEKKYPFLTDLLAKNKPPSGVWCFDFFKIVPESIRLIDNRVYFGYRAVMLI